MLPKKKRRMLQRMQHSIRKKQASNQTLVEKRSKLDAEKKLDSKKKRAKSEK